MAVLKILQRREPDLMAQAITSVPPPPPPLPTDFARQDWGLAIGICFLVGHKLWQMLSGQLTADSNLQNELIKALVDERKMLLAAVLERKP